MTPEQIEAKALEQFPPEGMKQIESGEIEHDENADLRAAFIKGCQYSATPSAVSGLQWVKASERLPDHTKTPLVNLKWNGKPDFMCWQVDSWCSEGDVIEDIAWQNIEWLDESSPAKSGYSEQQVREAIGLARKNIAEHPGLDEGHTPDEIISLLNKQP